MASHPITKLTEEEYLAIDRAADVRSEYIAGEIYAMAGASLNHIRLQGNTFGELYVALRNSDCQVCGSDFRVRTSASHSHLYPDVSVFCGKPQLADGRADILLNPIVIIEVLSPSTESFDRGLKFRHYRSIESLKDYILIDQTQVLIEHYTRHGQVEWNVTYAQELDSEVRIDSLQVTLSVRRIYNGIEFPAA